MTKHLRLLFLCLKSMPLFGMKTPRDKGTNKASLGLGFSPNLRN